MQRRGRTAGSPVLSKRNLLLTYYLQEHIRYDKGGLQAISSLLAASARIEAIIGPGCNGACLATAYLVSGRGIPQISYGTPALFLSMPIHNQSSRIIPNLVYIFITYRHILPPHRLCGWCDMAHSGGRLHLTKALEQNAFPAVCAHGLTVHVDEVSARPTDGDIQLDTLRRDVHHRPSSP